MLCCHFFHVLRAHTAEEMMCLRNTCLETEYQNFSETGNEKIIQHAASNSHTTNLLRQRINRPGLILKNSHLSAFAHIKTSAHKRV